MALPLLHELQKMLNLNSRSAFAAWEDFTRLHVGMSEAYAYSEVSSSSFTGTRNTPSGWQHMRQKHIWCWCVLWDICIKLLPLLLLLRLFASNAGNGRQASYLCCACARNTSSFFDNSAFVPSLFILRSALHISCMRRS